VYERSSVSTSIEAGGHPRYAVPARGPRARRFHTQGLRPRKQSAIVALGDLESGTNALRPADLATRVPEQGDPGEGVRRVGRRRRARSVGHAGVDTNRQRYVVRRATICKLLPRVEHAPGLPRCLSEWRWADKERPEEAPNELTRTNSVDAPPHLACLVVGEIKAWERVDVARQALVPFAIDFEGAPWPASRHRWRGVKTRLGRPIPPSWCSSFRGRASQPLSETARRQPVSSGRFRHLRW
jgi:hypothetical protein